MASCNGDNLVLLSPTTRSNSNGDRQDKAEGGSSSPHLKFLLETLSTEIYRDGGASLVTSLKDYMPPPKKKFDTLLRSYYNNNNNNNNNSSTISKGTGKVKLLTFLEEHSDVFQVDRTATPHWVVLKTNEFVIVNDNNDKKDDSATKAKQQLLEKAMYVLRKRQAKLERRAQKQQLLWTDNNNNNNNNNNINYDCDVNSHWLVKECQWEFHTYLRKIGYYPQHLYLCPDDVRPVGSREWQNLVLSKFETVLQEKESKSILKLQNGKVWLVSSTITKEKMNHDNDHSDGNATKDDNNDDDWKDLEELLTRLVQDDGGHQVSLDLLLHRHASLKRCLGGRDFWKLYTKQQQEQQQQEQRLQRKITNTATESTTTATSMPSSMSLLITKEGDQIILKSSERKVGRMQVDDEGLFSVTNSKWGTAIGNIMVKCCRQVVVVESEGEGDGGDDDDDSKGGEEGGIGGSSDTTTTTNKTKKKNDATSNVHSDANAYLSTKPMLVGIDLTASIGGMTLGLAKTRQFDRIIAMEIDPGRAKLCQENMERHGVAQNPVEVWNEDSVQALSKVARVLAETTITTTTTTTTTSSFPPLCVVIDPPWGGYQYKQRRRHEPLKMGKWLLEEVVEQIAIHLPICVVGLRLPLTFELETFVSTLRGEQYQLDLDVLDIRKLSVQLLVVLHVRGKA